MYDYDDITSNYIRISKLIENFISIFNFFQHFYQDFAKLEHFDIGNYFIRIAKKKF